MLDLSTVALGPFFDFFFAVVFFWGADFLSGPAAVAVFDFLPAFFFTAFFDTLFFDVLFLAAFFFDALLVVEGCFSVFADFPNAAAQPSAYLSVDPTRRIDMVTL